LRDESAGFITSLPFDGFAVGGVSVGEPPELQHAMTKYTAPLLPENKVRYLMGVGHPKDILHSVSCGIDLFDCVLPTRMARHHCLYTLNGRINAMGAQWAEHNGPYEESSNFDCTEGYSAAYIRHLFKAGELLGSRLASLHNLAFYARMMQEIRDAIDNDSWPDLLKRYESA
jgi:queuine tRNA-ribosyltransferase